MTFEQWQHLHSYLLEDYGNPDALCRSAFDAGRATRDGQFERIQELNETISNYEAMKEGVQIRLADQQKIIDAQSKLIKYIDAMCEGVDSLQSTRVGQIKKLINDFNE